MEKMVENIVIQLIIATFTVVFTVILEKLVTKSPPNEISKHITLNTINEQPNIFIQPTQVIVKEKTIYKEKNSSSNDIGVFEMFIIGAVILSMVITGYMKFRVQIQIGIIGMALSLEIMVLIVAWFGIRKGLSFDNRIKSIMAFNILSVIMVPILVVLVEHPFMYKNVDKVAIVNNINQTGSFSVFDDMSITVFLTYQITGLVLAVVYMLYVLRANLFLIASINLVLQSRLNKLWAIIYKKTYKNHKNSITYIVIGSVLLVLSFFMVSGILANIYEKIK
ncbi:hypothetical protein [Sinanaerobacter chloroacetimidivorans]|jgi:hypothetical protein|uniref:Uncharacterized protein n=1 Tax=Sinanaerobacter chloroacetimidivorans TaxID=2818044 RepID=A0A8J7W5L8_9FIRM|nr:hypothetical protein [Sinanaerobacter chloroacetimidivorans]MBR0599773.1 hypothetical protein [Sinanaerobacter chloroacetimidivorans]